MAGCDEHLAYNIPDRTLCAAVMWSKLWARLKFGQRVVTDTETEIHRVCSESSNDYRRIRLWSMI